MILFEEGSLLCVSSQYRAHYHRPRNHQGEANEAGEPVHSSRTLLQDLGTLTKHRFRVPGTEGYEFHMLTRLTERQARALDLLGVPL